MTGSSRWGTCAAGKMKIVSYLSAEFLMGPHLGNNLVNLGILDAGPAGRGRAGPGPGRPARQEEEPGLGNGGLGRLAACYLDSLATLRVPAIGYGIRYEFGIFDQEIRDGWQVEITDKWLRLGNPWEICRPEIAYYGQASAATPSTFRDDEGRLRVRWVPDRVVKGIAYDTPVPGYRSGMTGPAAALEGRGGGVLRLPGLQRRRLLRGRGREDRLRDHLQGPLSQRRAGGRQEAAPEPAVFLRLLLAAGHDPDPPAARGPPSRTSPRASPCSSTTPTRPSPSPS